MIYCHPLGSLAATIFTPICKSLIFKEKTCMGLGYILHEGIVEPACKAVSKDAGVTLGSIGYKVYEFSSDPMASINNISKIPSDPLVICQAIYNETSAPTHFIFEMFTMFSFSAFVNGFVFPSEHKSMLQEFSIEAVTDLVSSTFADEMYPHIEKATGCEQVFDDYIREPLVASITHHS